MWPKSNSKHEIRNQIKFFKKLIIKLKSLEIFHEGKFIKENIKILIYQQNFQEFFETNNKIKYGEINECFLINDFNENSCINFNVILNSTIFKFQKKTRNFPEMPRKCIIV